MPRRLITFFIILMFLCLLALGTLVGIPALATRQYGPPSSALGLSDQFEYSARLLWHSNQLTHPPAPNGTEQPFTIESGEGVLSIAIRLEEVGLIQSATAFRDYLIYTGLDTSIQSGDYNLSPALSTVDIAHMLIAALTASVDTAALRPPPSRGTRGRGA